MKRDMDLFREILFYLEARPTGKIDVSTKFESTDFRASRVRALYTLLVALILHARHTITLRSRANISAFSGISLSNKTTGKERYK